MTYLYELALVSRLCPAEISLTRLSVSPQSGYQALHETARLNIAPDYESGGQEFESLRARQPNRYRALVFPFEVIDMAVPVCNWFANFVRGEFSKLKIACSASPLVRAR
jgi:hypothetical protein